MVVDRGLSNKNIARTLTISESTVKLHMGHIFKKYGVKSRTQLAVFANSQSKSIL
jgi:DNA-binding NarL/FixJ family response regulator